MAEQRGGAVRPGDRIGPYTVLTELAGGGMGRVYVARSPGGRTVAVKTLLGAADGGTIAPEDRRRFAREAALAQRVHGPFTAGIVGADADAEVPWMATEYIPAPSLHELVAGQGPLPPESLAWIAAGTAEALTDIHAAGLVHRDVKPSNILLPEEGPRVIDFGISQAADLTRTGNALGTIPFAAPEQARGEPTTPASDVFSLGATFFFLLTGRSPYRGMGHGTAMEQLVRAAEADLDLRGLPAEAAGLVLPCLAVAPADRPAPGALLDLVEPVLAARPQAHGAADWLPDDWSRAIERHRARRTQEAGAAGRRYATDAGTARAPRPAPNRTRRLPRPAPARARRLTPVTATLGVALAAGAAAAVYALLPDGPGLSPVRQDLRLALVEQTAAGECTDAMAPPTFYDEKTKTCFRVSTRDAERMSVKQLRKAESVLDPSMGSPLVNVTFQDADGKRFTALTELASKREAPRNQIAILLGDRLISAPSVASPIPGNEIQISGGFTKSEADALAVELGG
ncbi:protein kinase [Streptomyces sp. NPDC051771]|uniref:serine/threonine-protein kinase n=1 Tax=Streptomyces sp. NPDC051771 TaxID=3154847 RepID=UPI003449549D